MTSDDKFGGTDMDSLFKTVQQHKDVPLSEKVALQISELIKDRNIGIGDKLPNEFELAESLNVGRGTIREAVKLLVARNFLEIRRGKGTFVTEKLGKVTDPFGFELITDKIKLAEELFEIRVQLEPWIASLAAKRIQEEEKDQLRHYCEAVEKKIFAGENHSEEDLAFHHFIASCTHNDVLPEILSVITYSVQLFTRVRDPDMLRRTIEDHRATTDAICANEPEAAQANMRKHIMINFDYIERLKKESNPER